MPAAFSGTYDCGPGYTGTWSVADGGSQTVSGIPTGSTCSVTEDALAKIDGFTYKRRTNQRRRYGHRQKYSVVEITSIAKG